jgi:hypothetical protein
MNNKRKMEKKKSRDWDLSRTLKEWTGAQWARKCKEGMWVKSYPVENISTSLGAGGNTEMGGS